MNELTKIDTAAHSMVLEQAVLVSLMTINSSYDIAENLNIDTFYATRHREIFTAIDTLAKSAKKYDSTMVCDFLGSSHMMGDQTTEAYLCQILDNSPASLYNFNAYIELLNELSQKRKYEVILKTSLTALVDDRQTTTDDHIATLDSQIIKLAGANSTDDGMNSTQQAIDAVMQSFITDDAIPTGFNELDELVKIRAGQLVIVAARPAMGKTMLAVNIAENIMRHTEKPVLMFSMEMPAAEITKRILSSHSNVFLNKIDDKTMSESESVKFGNAAQNWKLQRFIINDKSTHTIDRLRQVAQKFKRENKGLGCILVDYLQLMVSANHTKNKNEAVAEISRGLKILARDLGCPVIALSQLSRDLEKRPDKRPMMSDLRDSGAIEQDADIILAIYRDEIYNKECKVKGFAEILCIKQRAGRTGAVMLKFEGYFGRFSNAMGMVDYGDDNV